MYLYDETKEIRNMTVGVGEECNYWEVGRKTPAHYDGSGVKSEGATVTKILAEQVAGDMGYVTWFAIYAGEELLTRVNQAYVSEIEYQREEK